MGQGTRGAMGRARAALLLLFGCVAGACGGGGTTAPPDVHDVPDSIVVPSDVPVASDPTDAGLADLPDGGPAPTDGGPDEIAGPDVPRADASDVGDADAGPVACTPETELEDCAVIEDGNPCSVPRCRGGACVLVAADDRACDDGDRCTAPDDCLGGVCVSGPDLDCDDGDPCTVDSCAPATGCLHTDDPACAGCACTSDPDCDDDDPCTDDRCAVTVIDPCVSHCENLRREGGLATTGCERRPCGGDAHCDDGNPCTEDRCQAMGGAGEPLPVADRLCAYDARPQCTPPAALACGAATDCDPTRCVPDGPDAACVSPSDGCPTAICDAGVGCRFVPTAACPFAPDCTPPTAVSDCWDGDTCTSDACDPVTLTCAYESLLGDDNRYTYCYTCNDVSECRAPDVWVNGACPAVSCLPFPAPSPLDPEWFGYCFTPSPVMGAGPTCEDFDLCTTDTCLGDGACAHTDPPPGCRYCNDDSECDDEDGCTTDRCEWPGRGCVNELRPGCLPCTELQDCPSDGPCGFQFCNQGRCQPIEPGVDGAGCVEQACTGTADCDDGDAATLDSCVTGHGRCLYLPSPDRPGFTCDWDADCLVGEACRITRCVEGVCTNEPDPDCEPQACARNLDCADGDPCSLGLCLNGVCAQASDEPDCCSTTSDCEFPLDEAPAFCLVPHCDGSRSCGWASVAHVVHCGAFCESDNDCQRRCDESAGVCRSFCLVDGVCHDWPCAEGFCGPTGQCAWFSGDCRECHTDFDCLDGDPCSADVCVDGGCTHELIDDCAPVACDRANPCDSGDPCVLGLCLSTGCVWLPSPECLD